jgi:molybdopterin-containing oxidoreductase family membrane subunit
VITLVVPIRKIFRLEEYITIDNFDGMAKLIMVTSGIVTYAYAAEFLLAWYSGSPYEWGQFLYRVKGQYALFYWIMIFCNSVVPILLWFKEVRRNITPIHNFLFINVGMWFERFNIIVISLSQGFGPGHGVFINQLGWSWASQWVALLVFHVFLLFIKTLPAVSIAEMKEILPIPRKEAGGK